MRNAIQESQISEKNSKNSLNSPLKHQKLHLNHGETSPRNSVK